MISEDGQVDTSEKYIKMCESAKEIQRKWVFQPGDFVYNPASEGVEALLHPGNNSINYFWLPRQDQLQKICIEFFMQNLEISEFEAFLKFWNGILDALNILSNMGSSMETFSSTRAKNFS